VSEHRSANLEAAVGFNPCGDELSYAPGGESHSTYALARYLIVLLTAQRLEIDAFCDNHDGERIVGTATFDEVRHDLFHGEREFRDNYEVRAAGESAHGGNPPSGTTHRFDDHDPVVRGSRRVEAVERLGDNTYCGIEAYAVVSSLQVIVEGLGYSHDRSPSFSEPVGNSLRTVATNCHQRVKVLVNGGEYTISTALGIIEVVTRRAEQRPALTHDAGQFLV
jgi:hypothetical protein